MDSLKSPQITKWFRRHPFIILNLLILLFSLFWGARVFKGAFGFADGINMFSPYPIIGVSGRVVVDFWEYVWDWYNGMNGRTCQAILDGLIFVYSKMFIAAPEDFPWWLTRSLSLFCAIAAPLNFLIPAFRARLISRKATFFMLLAIWGAWTLSNNVVSYALWFDCLLTDRFLLIFLVSVMCLVLYMGYLDQKLYWIVLHGFLYIFLSVEQFMVTVPFLFLAFTWAGVGKNRPLAFWIKRIVLYFLLSSLAALAYYYSPGQRLRNLALTPNPDGFSVRGFLLWLEQDLPRGYNMLFGEHGGIAMFILHGLLYLGILLAAIVTTCAFYKSKRHQGSVRERIDNLFSLSVLAAAFLTAYMASLSTLLISRHFPEYAIHYPAILLALGLAFGVLTIIQFFDSKTRQALRIVLTGAEDVGVTAAISSNPWGTVTTAAVCLVILLGVTRPTLPKLRASYDEVMMHNRLRHVVFQHVIDSYLATGQTHFILTQCPTRSYGGTMEPPWGVEGYFRWRGYKDLRVYLDDNYDFPSRPKDKPYVTISCSTFMEKGCKE